LNEYISFTLVSSNLKKK